jgi:hypothetical protein
VKNGLVSPKYVEADTGLKPLRGDSRFEAAVATTRVATHQDKIVPEAVSRPKLTMQNNPGCVSGDSWCGSGKQTHPKVKHPPRRLYVWREARRDACQVATGQEAM